MHLHIGEGMAQVWLGFTPGCRSGSGLFPVSLSGLRLKRQLPGACSSHRGLQEHKKPGQTMHTLQVAACCKSANIPGAKASHVAKPNTSGAEKGCLPMLVRDA